MKAFLAKYLGISKALFQANNISPLSLKGPLKSDEGSTDVDSLKEFTTGMIPVALSEFKHLTKKFGFDFGPSFSLIKMIWRGIEEAVCCIEIDRDEIKNEMDRYIVHPAILDACLQTSVAVEDTDDDSSETKPTTFPVRIKRLLLLDRNIPEKTLCHVSKHTHRNWVTLLHESDGFERKHFNQSTRISGNRTEYPYPVPQA